MFCDRGAFSAEEAEQIFEAAAANGLALRAHMGQLGETRLEPFLRHRPASLDHMDYVNDADLPALRGVETVATFVPGANYFLGLTRYPAARTFIEAEWRWRWRRTITPDLADAEYADGDVAGVYAHEDGAGGGIAAATINGAWALGWRIAKAALSRGRTQTWRCST